MRALCIPTAGDVRVVDVEVTLSWLQQQVGGYIQPVYVDQVLTDRGRREVDACVYVNEEGKLDGLPVNPRATDFCALAIGGWLRDIIVGDVVIVGPPGPDGEGTPVPDDAIAVVREWGWLADTEAA